MIVIEDGMQSIPYLTSRRCAAEVGKEKAGSRW